MTAPAGQGAPAESGVDLRRAPLEDVRAIRFRDEGRDFRADEAALWDRFRASWAGLDDAAWRLPGAAPSDAGGPPWSLLDHVAHVVDWQEIACGYVSRVLAGGRWPDDADYDGGDFDRYNERRREPWAALPPDEILRRGERSHAALLELIDRLPPGTIRSHEAWSWVFMVLHGHHLDHLWVLEPWGDRLRARQADGDPFGAHPYAQADSDRDSEGFFAAADAALDRLVGQVDSLGDAAWDLEVTEGWSVKDHVGHVAAWLEEARDALDEWRETQRWRTYEETEDDWNAREVARWRTVPAPLVLERLQAAHRAVVERARALPPDVLWSYDGLGWTYEVLHGHVRRHLALVAPIAVRASWPPAAR
ncbi:MAG TPA: maleylpyruvate isomerase N-terminal domain-containing protein [Candidatus Limnocylindrales bacterium]|nr:maleylpyruvate isomerase N-terminal domain-containing protein [Candidatus Limnocylindrales bacterium]